MSLEDNLKVVWTFKATDTMGSLLVVRGRDVSWSVRVNYREAQVRFGRKLKAGKGQGSGQPASFHDEVHTWIYSHATTYWGWSSPVTRRHVKLHDDKRLEQQAREAICALQTVSYLLFSSRISYFFDSVLTARIVIWPEHTCNRHTSAIMRPKMYLKWHVTLPQATAWGGQSMRHRW